MKEEIISRIKQTARIEEVIGNLVEIHKDGANLKCKCPFHNDTHPSLKINVAKQYWRCFVCDKGGDAIEFVKEYKRCNYIEALEEIAKQYHIDTSDRDVHKAYNADEKYTKAQKRMMYAAGSMADELSAYLFSGEGENALRYLKEERGLSEETIKAFRLGYASDDDGLHIKNLRREGYNSDDFRNLKMLDTNYKGEEYFAYKGRLMFPIVEEEQGRVISFAGRLLPGKENVKGAKYINGKESDVYRKSDVLYGLYQAKDYIKQEKQVYITEGYCDVISMHQRGSVTRWRVAAPH
ncbi:MAG: CHC2 zinc finger domain-containing protein [Bacteroidaceae bacterium]|nr:CHC2 zinc finger domain-containing protein [Bacteroidaceae bacterium]